MHHFQFQVLLVSALFSFNHWRIASSRYRSDESRVALFVVPASFSVGGEGSTLRIVDPIAPKFRRIKARTLLDERNPAESDPYVGALKNTIHMIVFDRRAEFSFVYYLSR